MMATLSPAESPAADPTPDEAPRLYLYGIFDKDQYQEAATWAFLRREDRDTFQLHHMAALYEVGLTGDAEHDQTQVWECYNNTGDDLNIWTADIPLTGPGDLAGALARLQQEGPWGGA